MKALFILIVLCICLAIGIRVFQKFTAPKPPVPSSVGGTPSPEKKKGVLESVFSLPEAAKKPEAKAREDERLSVGRPKPQKGTYDIVRERLRAEYGSQFLRTDNGQYEVGRMSVNGLVEQISNRVARCRLPDMRLVFVVCDDSTQFLPASGFPAPGEAAAGAVENLVRSSPPVFRVGEAAPTPKPVSVVRGGRVVDLVPSPSAAVSEERNQRDKTANGTAPWSPAAVPGW